MFKSCAVEICFNLEEQYAGALGNALVEYVVGQTARQRHKGAAQIQPRVRQNNFALNVKMGAMVLAFSAWLGLISRMGDATGALWESSALQVRLLVLFARLGNFMPIC